MPLDSGGRSASMGPMPRKPVTAKRPRADAAADADEGIEARFRAIFDTVVDGILTIDEQGIIESANPAAERIFGWRAKDLIGHRVNRLMPPPWDRQHDGYIQRYLRTGKARVIGIGREVTGLRRDGTTFPMELAVSELRADGRRLFTGIIRDITERKRAEQAIASVSEEERRRFGRELHDGLGQQLTGLALLCKALELKLQGARHPAREDAAALADLAGRIMQDMRRQAHGLYPVELERHGLTAALEELAQNQSDLFKVDCTFRQQGQPPALETATALHLYRIAQEAVHNAVKHGAARHIAVRLERQGAMISLVVQDDGKGWPKRKPRNPGMGLAIMRHRAAAVGATLEIEPGHPRGTTVRVQGRLG